MPSSKDLINNRPVLVPAIYLIDNNPNDLTEWNTYVFNHERSTIYHDIRWKKVIEKTFGHKPFFISIRNGGTIKGVLPLFLMKSFIFGNYLVSLPFIDTGGVLADDAQSAHQLVDMAIDIAQEAKVDFLELRNTCEIEHSQLITRSHKVHYDLALTSDPQVLWKKVIHENVRNKVRKALKNQLHIELGNSEQFVTVFHRVFSRNMRDLGTPAYPKKFFLNIAKEFPDEMKIFLTYYKGTVIGGKMVFFFKDTVYFIYHSSNREYANFAPNNLLY
jgi:FemAB-related protein (PEP-CTERM system-associated)